MTIKQTHRITLMAVALAILPAGLTVHAQDKSPTEEPTPSTPVDPCYAMRNSPTETRTFYLTNVPQQNDANETMVAIRNVLCPSVKIYLDTAQHALIVQAASEQLALAQKVIADLDRPGRSYRLTYTITDLDAGKTIGTKHFSMIVVPGQRTSMKEGNKIPVATGSYANGVAATSPSSEVQTQFTYLDIGMSFDSTVDEVANGAYLKSKVEQSSLGEPSTIAGVTEPVVRQSVIEGASFLTLNKPAMLGSIDVPNSTRHFDIAVVLDQVK